MDVENNKDDVKAPGLVVTCYMVQGAACARISLLASLIDGVIGDKMSFRINEEEKTVEFYDENPLISMPYKIGGKHRKSFVLQNQKKASVFIVNRWIGEFDVERVGDHFVAHMYEKPVNEQMLHMECDWIIRNVETFGNSVVPKKTLKLFTKQTIEEFISVNVGKKVEVICIPHSKDGDTYIAKVERKK